MLLEVRHEMSSSNRHKTVHLAKLRCDVCSLEWEVRGCPRVELQRSHCCSRPCNALYQSQSLEFSRTVSASIEKRRANPVRKQAHSEANSRRMNHLYSTRPEMRKKQSIARRQRWKDLQYRASMTGVNHPNTGTINSWWQHWMEREITGRAWVARIRKLSGGRCLICCTKKNLHAHHIVPRSIAPELTLDLNNGISLCSTCHDGKDNPQNVHRLLREDVKRYQELMQELLSKREL